MKKYLLFRLAKRSFRIQYFRGSIIRCLIAIALSGMYIFLSHLFGWDVVSDLADGGDGIFDYLSDPFLEVSFFVIFVPWDLRRMKDAGINWWWIVLFEILLRLPAPPEIEGSDFVVHNVVHGIFSTVPYLVFTLILIFKPGKIYRDFIRKSPFRRNNNSKVTFSE